MNQKKEKILLCVNADIGRKVSIGFRFEKIARELKKQGKEFEIIGRANYSNFSVKTPFYKNYLARIFNGLRIYFFPFLKFRKLDAFLFDRFALKELKKMKKKGIVFSLAHFGEFASKSMDFLKKENVKILLDIPIGHYKYAKNLLELGFQWDSKLEKSNFIDKAIKQADMLIIPSLFVKETLELADWKEKEMKIINFGASLPENFGEKDILKRVEDFKNNKIPLRFVFSGAINFRKGANFLLEAWQKANLENAELLFCGRIYKGISKIIIKMKLKNVKFLGFVDCAKYLRNSHIFVLPSLLEGSAKSNFEALSFGLPLITTFNSGSVIENEKHGFIIPIGNSEILTEKIKYFYNNPDKIAEMGINSFKISKNYTWDKYGENILKLYFEEL
jgi:glycosyltransferase involved in cell wall biosynthesis